ncbi:hypothetical protein J6590_073390 [Homalodisca vitripennis]|nr:hypothetical protein J6590_073390 [Homalodisca vitripennis]
MASNRSNFVFELEEDITHLNEILSNDISEGNSVNLNESDTDSEESVEECSECSESEQSGDEDVQEERNVPVTEEEGRSDEQQPCCFSHNSHYPSLNITRDKFGRVRDAKPTDIIELKARIGLLYLLGVNHFNRQNLIEVWATGSGKEKLRMTTSLRHFKISIQCLNDLFNVIAKINVVTNTHHTHTSESGPLNTHIVLQQPLNTSTPTRLFEYPKNILHKLCNEQTKTVPQEGSPLTGVLLSSSTCGVQLRKTADKLSFPRAVPAKFSQCLQSGDKKNLCQ